MTAVVQMMCNISIIGRRTENAIVDVHDLTPEQLKELVKGLVDDRLRELLGDPDLGSPMGEALRERLKRSLASTERISGDDIAEKLGLRW